MHMNEQDEVVIADEIIFNAKSSNPTSTPSQRRSFKTSSDEFSFVRKKRNLSPEKRKELEDIYQSVVVNDYGDEYHMSEEERKRKFRYYEVFMKLRKCKRKFRKLDEYVRVYRLCLDCLDVVAADNGVYDSEKFKKMVIKGKIEVFGLNFPKYVGKDKKDINWEYISDFIVDYSQDPKELAKGKETAISEMDDDEAQELLFDEEQFNRIMDSIINPNTDSVMRPYDENDEKSDDVVIVADKSDTKDLMRFCPELLKQMKEAVKEQRRRNSSNGKLNSFVFEMTSDDFDYIQKLDQSRNYVSESDVPEFHGDIMNRSDYMKYLMELENYEKNQIKVNYNGKMKTQSEIDEIELKDALEAAGWNVRNLYKQKDKDKKLKKAYKKDKKREEELKKRLIAVQKRQKSRNGKKSSEIEFDAKKKKKKNKDKEAKKESD